MEQIQSTNQPLPPVVDKLLDFYEWCKNNDIDRKLLGRQGYQDTVDEILAAHGFDPRSVDAQAIARGTAAIAEEIHGDTATSELNNFMLLKQAGETQGITQLAEERTMDILAQPGTKRVVATEVRYESLCYFDGINALAGYLLAESIDQEQ
jgi:hypothetical protein